MTPMEGRGRRRGGAGPGTEGCLHAHAELDVGPGEHLDGLCGHGGRGGVRGGGHGDAGPEEHGCPGVRGAALARRRC